jgi:hypothetical protein
LQFSLTPVIFLSYTAAMKKFDVPQDEIPIFHGEKKVLYAVDETGRYAAVQSSGWDVERVVLEQALDDYEQKAEAAKRRIKDGESSPLEYFMYKRRMDSRVLAQATGFAGWRVKRHLKPEHFNKLKDSTMQEYALVLQVSPDVLKRFDGA